ncbi:hypothetical protein ACIBBB_01240 [Streptomyces sp. NPDC051217]|uniref:hypothetical protein n=1 Tax=Streptomyces sp. NPDC051217 TaxID=3365644 RepID=UPI0037AC44F3
MTAVTRGGHGEIQLLDVDRPVAVRTVNSPPPGGGSPSLVSRGGRADEDPPGGCSPAL